MLSSTAKQYRQRFIGAEKDSNGRQNRGERPDIGYAFGVTIWGAR